VAVALDSNVVVGFLDRSDALHQAADEAIRELLRADQLVVSVITYAEVMTGARLGHHDQGSVEGFFKELVSRILPVDVPIGDRAASLRAQGKAISMPDALIAATAALDRQVDLLLSGDQGVKKLKGLGCKVQLLAPAG
jgi:predicted nucleic acid-binding protein